MTEKPSIKDQIEEIKGHIVSNIFELLIERERLSLADVVQGIENIVNGIEKIINLKVVTTIGDELSS